MAGLLVLEDFAPAVGDAFTVAGAGPALALTLVEARPLGGARHDGRAPFALLFRGPADRALPQATYALAHARLGEQPIFVVPVGRGPDGVEYEAIFT